LQELYLHDLILHAVLAYQTLDHLLHCIELQGYPPQAASAYGAPAAAAYNAARGGYNTYGNPAGTGAGAPGSGYNAAPAPGGYLSGVLEFWH
jgi:hypothetical protein